MGLAPDGSWECGPALYRSEVLPLRDVFSLRMLAGGWAGWECPAAVVAVVVAVAVAPPKLP